MDETNKRIGIMGGTFDPIHTGHLLIAENAASQYELDEIWFIPTGHSPHKTQKNITDASHRCEMIQLAISDNPRFRLSRLEVESRETNYTYRTLEYLNQQYPQVKFYFIMGGDSLRDFETWKEPGRILKAAPILAAIRENVEGTEFYHLIEHLNETYEGAKVSALSTPNFSISSRSIRELVRNDKTIRYMLPESVRAYIMEHKLYGTK